MALVSKSSVKRLATIGLMGDPIAASLKLFKKPAMELEIHGL